MVARSSAEPSCAPLAHWDVLIAKAEASIRYPWRELNRSVQLGITRQHIFNVIGAEYLRYSYLSGHT